MLAALIAMTILVAGQRVLLPLFVDRTSLDGLQLFAIYQALIIPVWIAPFLGLLKGQNPLLLSVYVLVGPSFASWAGIYYMHDLNGILIGLVCYALVGLVWILINTTFIRDLQLKKMLVSLWPATWPLVMYAISTGLARGFDAWLVAHHFDASSFAVFRYGARDFPIAMAFAAGLSTVMIPKLMANEALAELRLRSTRLMHLCFPLVALVMLFSPVLFSFFFGYAYKESAVIFNIYLLLTLTQLVFPQTVMTARGDTRWLWYISLAELAVNITASIILLSLFGLAGIAWGTLIAFVFEKAALLVFVKSRYDVRPRQLFNVPVLVVYSLVLSVSFITSQWLFGV
jgi:O-antigen/teichoic acid export membrane protein